MKLVLPNSLHFRRGVRRGLTSLRRERGWKTTLCLLSGLLLLLQFCFVVAAGVQGMDRLLRSQLDLRLELKEGVPAAQVQDFLDALKTQSTVAHVVYITREQAYQSEKERNPSLIGFLEQFNIQNPFPDTVAVTLNRLDDYEAFSATIRQPQWSAVVDPAFLSAVTDQENEVMNLLSLTQSGRKLMSVVLAFLGVVLLFITVELVRRRALYRQEEIFVEQLTGASSIWILTPFITEATVLLWAGLLLSSVTMAILVFVLPLLVPMVATLGEFAVLRQQLLAVIFALWPWVLGLEIVAAPIVAFVGAVLALRLHLRDQVVNVLRRLKWRKVGA
jgi:cell division transport system permease protein